MQITLILALVGAMLFGLNAWQWKRNGALSEKMAATEQELVDARESAERLAEASKDHQRVVDRLSRDARKAATVVASFQGGCWDADAGDPAVDALRMLNKDYTADTASADKRKNGP